MANYVHKIRFLASIILSWFVIFELVSAGDSITTTEFLRDPETLVSSNGIFKFGFFSPINSTNRYVGIWYNKKDADTMEVVWVANRETPLNNTSGVVKISMDGNIRLLDGQNNSIWSSNVATKDDLNASVAQLRHTGNLVLLSSAGGSVIWQSFDHPTDSLLPLMQVTIDGNVTVWRLIASWKNTSDPSSGRFIGGLNHRMLSEIFIWDGDRPYWRSGPWDGTVFLGVRAMYYSAPEDGFQIESENGNLSLSFFSASKRVTEHYVMSSDGMGLERDWDDDNGNWTVLWQSLESECDVFGKCGEFGSCNSNNAPICSCLRGFEPRNNGEWTAGNWSSGCVRRQPLQCETIGGNGDEDGFLRVKKIKVPDNAQWLDTNDEDDCRTQCLRNCSCLAYAYYLGFGCMIWNESLVDIQEFSDVGVDVFIRLAKSELGGGNKWKVIIAIIVIMGTIALITLLYCLWKLMLQRYGNKITNKDERENNNSVVVPTARSVEFQDLPLYRFEDLVAATNDFLENNKLGRGGFGSVYKGRIHGQDIAVKRLCRTSVQGLQEFMNEVIVISKLQHRNLVRLLGCCVEGEEKLLVYEYMPNKSLDAFLFDPSNREHLDWNKRFNIIKGISRGLLYLHRDSRLKIVHRDLKASNILLDENLSPKISDFGMARIFGGNEDQADTKRIVGTYGYMSPEYAMEGIFSEKSDVFSFGVLLLEIVSGRRNSNFMSEESCSLIGHAWKLWKEDECWSLVDPIMSESNFKAEILRCIHLGLLCVEDIPENRPSITMVVSMIENEGTDLPCPIQPGFIHRRMVTRNEGQQSSQYYSSNYVSVSLLTGR